MADLSLDNVIGYSDLVLLDTSFVSRDFGIGQKLYFLENFFECEDLTGAILKTISYYEEIRKLAIRNPSKVKINSEVAEEFSGFAAHIQNCLEYYQFQSATTDGKMKLGNREGTNKFNRYTKDIHKTREQALDFNRGKSKKDKHKELYGLPVLRRLEQVNALYLSINRLIRGIDRYSGEEIKIEPRLKNISDTDHKIVGSALGSLLEKEIRKTSIVTGDQDFIDLLAGYYYTQKVHPGYLGKVFVYVIGDNSNQINNLLLKNKSSLEFKPDRLIYSHDRCDGNGCKVQTKMFSMQEELGRGYQPDQICSLLSMSERSDGRRDYRSRT